MNSKFMGLYKKELKIFFSLPIAYALIIMFMVISGYFFANITSQYAQYSMKAMNEYQRSMIDLSIFMIFRNNFSNLAFLLLFFVPMITMRIFAEEKREGTSELLFTFPVSDLTILSAKYASALTVFLAMLIGTMSSVMILRTITPFGMMPVLGGLLGLFLLGSAFMMLGIFISALTESQIVAAVISFGALLFFWMIDWLSVSVSPAIAKVLSNVSIIKHFDSFSKGVLDTADIAYYLVFIFIFFFLSLRVLESKQWRG